MPLITWSDKFSINVKTIDEQHRRLFDLANNLADQDISSCSRETFDKVLNELIDYTKYHFSSEEKLMLENDYPYLAQQKIDHEIFTQKVMGFREDFMEGKAVSTIEFLKFLYDWLARHILEKDKKIGHYLETKILRA